MQRWVNKLAVLTLIWQPAASWQWQEIRFAVVTLIGDALSRYVAARLHKTRCPHRATRPS